jgi:hypothetical protein
MRRAGPPAPPASTQQIAELRDQGLGRPPGTAQSDESSLSLVTNGT